MSKERDMVKACRCGIRTQIMRLNTRAVGKMAMHMVAACSDLSAAAICTEVNSLRTREQEVFSSGKTLR